MSETEGLREAIEAFAAAHDNENWRGWGIPQGLRRILADHPESAAEAKVARVEALAGAWEHQDRYFPSGPQYAVDLRAALDGDPS